MYTPRGYSRGVPKLKMKIAKKSVKVSEIASMAPSVIAGGCCHEEAAAPADGRKAVGVDSDAKRRNLLRLKRIEGQIRGVHKMIEGDRYCADILSQVAAVQEALRSVGRELMRNHLRHCATSAFAAGDEQRDLMCDEIIDLMYTNAR